jgi:hypothetical protein
MDANRTRFAELIDSMVHHIALKKGGRQKYEVTENELALALHVSQSTLQTWRKGRHLPADPYGITEELARIGVQSYGMGRPWAEALLNSISHPNPERVLKNLFHSAENDMLRTIAPITPSDYLESSESPIPLGSPLYIERIGDRRALDAIRQDGVTLTIKGPPKMGKTSLLYRVRAAAEAQGKRTLHLDFQEFDALALQDAGTFFRQFCQRISEELELPDDVLSNWSQASTNPANCRRFLLRNVLMRIDGRLVLALENVDRIFGASFRAEFFGMLRSWHDDSQYRPEWRRLDRVLVTSTEPYQFIEDIHKSPFNVGVVVELDDFTVKQVAELNLRYGTVLSEHNLHALMELLHGQPYLVRRSLEMVARGFITADELIARATQDDGPFRNHLWQLLSDLMAAPHQLREAMQQVILTQSCANHTDYFRLRGAGLVRRSGAQVLPRCQLYATFLMEHLHGK